MIVIQALYFALPMYLANMVPVFVKKIHLLNYPIDYNKSWRGKSLLGKHKTWRGLVFGVTSAVLAVYCQWLLDLTAINIIDYDLINKFLLGFLMGFGALFGDMIKSFFKRQKNRKPGSSWPPFDQMDFIIGGLLFTCLIFVPDWKIIVILLICTPILHVFANFMGYKLGIKEVPW